MQVNGLRWAIDRALDRLNFRPPAQPTPVAATAPADPSATPVQQSAALTDANRLADDTLFAFYDLDIHPISFDIGWFVVCADLEREKRGLERLHVVFVPMADPFNRPMPPGYDAIVDLRSRFYRFENIVIPFAMMLPSASGYTVCDTREQAALYRRIAPHRFPADGERPSHPEYSQAIMRDLPKGRKEWGFRAHPQALRYVRQWLATNVGERKPIVITLRQYKVDAERNSDPESWTAFCRSLAGTEYCPVIVPDTDHAFDPSENWYREFPVFEAACWNIALRMAIYESAYLNLYVNTGPALLCYLGSVCRYVFFKVVFDGVHLASTAFLKQLGFERDTSPCYATPFQKWVWEPDTLEIIQREFRAMCARIEESKAAETTITPAGRPRERSPAIELARPA